MRDPHCKSDSRGGSPYTDRATRCSLVGRRGRISANRADPVGAADAAPELPLVEEDDDDDDEAELDTADPVLGTVELAAAAGLPEEVSLVALAFLDELADDTPPS